MEIDAYRADQLTGRVIESIIHVHQTLGPGFLENVYRRALLIELRKRNLATENEKEFVVHYDGQEVGKHRLDLLVEGHVIIELKTVEALSKAHYAQVRSYPRAARLNVALLVNFAADRADFRRIQAWKAGEGPPAGDVHGRLKKCEKWSAGNEGDVGDDR